MTRKPNIIWITLDSVRQDRTTMGGHSRDTTPHLQQIADSSSGMSFDQCISHGRYTLASSASVLTGTYPSHNTAGINGESIPDELMTVPELFAEQGYWTGCISRNSFISDATGLDRGFDQFEWISSSTLLRAVHPMTLLKYLLNIRRHSAGFQLDTAKHSSAFLMNDTAKRWLRDVDEPFFFYLHYNEPHSPYYPPGLYSDVFADELEMTPREAAEIAIDVHYNLIEIMANGCNLSDEEWAALRVMYDSEVAYTDYCIGRLFEHIQSLDLGPTVVVITADHGELLGEHDSIGHRFSLYDGLLNVPLVVHDLDGLIVERDDIVQHIDLVQTLLNRAGGDTAQLQGVDLSETKRDYAIAQDGPVDIDPFLEYNPEFDFSPFDKGVLTCLRTDKFKYQQSDGYEALFALPDEGTDVAEEHPEIRERLARSLTEWLETDGQPVSTGRNAEFTDAMTRQLRDLGYVE